MVRSIVYVLLLFSTLVTSSWGERLARPIVISVDASEAPSKILHSNLLIPVSPGPLTLYYPKWIPHTPNGPINDLAGLKIMALNRPLTWRRDSVDMFAFHLEVPAGANFITVFLDCLTHRFPSASAKVAVIDWNQLLLYPAGKTAEELTMTASLRLPTGWRFGTSLPVLTQSEAEIRFQPTSLYALADSPVIVGEYFRIIPLSEGTPVHEIDAAADSPTALEADAGLIAHYTRLVSEAYALFGARHYRDYHFLLGLSDLVPASGMEHHESSEDHMSEGGLTDPYELKLRAALLPHEFAHSWNGKYRRPADLYTLDYQQPMRTSLLWVYEGFTQYLGNLLAARSGLWNEEQYRDDLAMIAAEMDNRPGRTWRPLQDTADAAPILYDAPQRWQSWRRTAQDFYDESLMIWLEAEVRIREQSHGRRSLNDFCRLFFGPPDSLPKVKTYTFDDVVNALSSIVPDDWRGFFTERLMSTEPRAPLGGVEGSGWHLVYDGTPSELLVAQERLQKVVNAVYSIGLELGNDGSVIDSVFGMPAAQAGILPGMQVIAVNGQQFSKDVLERALQVGKKSPQPLELLVEDGRYFQTYRLDYHAGEKYPHLQRDPNKADLLSQIVKPLATAGQ